MAKLKHIKSIDESLLPGLNDRERAVLELYFGLIEEPMTLEKIGLKFGLTRERIRQIKEKALIKLNSPSLKFEVRSKEWRERDITILAHTYLNYNFPEIYELFRLKEPSVTLKLRQLYQNEFGSWDIERILELERESQQYSLPRLREGVIDIINQYRLKKENLECLLGREREEKVLRRNLRESNKRAILAAYQSGVDVSDVDIAYFLNLKRYDGKLPGLNISLVSVILSKSDVKSSRRKPKRFGFYKMASQIYAYKDMGASDNEIAQILLEEEKVIRRGTNGSYSFPSRMGEWEILSIMPNIMSLRAEIEPKLIVVLRAMFPDEEINQPYR